MLAKFKTFFELEMSPRHCKLKNLMIFVYLCMMLRFLKRIKRRFFTLVILLHNSVGFDIGDFG